jgi:hypothetical protein
LDENFLWIIVALLAKQILNSKQGTVYQINQRLSVVLKRGVGEQLIAYECVD